MRWAQDSVSLWEAFKASCGRSAAVAPRSQRQRLPQLPPRDVYPHKFRGAWFFHAHLKIFVLKTFLLDGYKMHDISNFLEAWRCTPHPRLVAAFLSALLTPGSCSWHHGRETWLMVSLGLFCCHKEKSSTPRRMELCNCSDWNYHKGGITS